MNADFEWVETDAEDRIEQQWLEMARDHPVRQRNCHEVSAREQLLMLFHAILTNGFQPWKHA